MISHTGTHRPWRKCLGTSFLSTFRPLQNALLECDGNERAFYRRGNNGSFPCPSAGLLREMGSSDEFWMGEALVEVSLTTRTPLS